MLGKVHSTETVSLAHKRRINSQERERERRAGQKATSDIHSVRVSVYIYKECTHIFSRRGARLPEPVSFSPSRPSALALLRWVRKPHVLGRVFLVLALAIRARLAPVIEWPAAKVRQGGRASFSRALAAPRVVTRSVQMVAGVKYRGHKRAFIRAAFSISTRVHTPHISRGRSTIQCTGATHSRERHDKSPQSPSGPSCIAIPAI